MKAAITLFVCLLVSCVVRGQDAAEDEAEKETEGSKRKEKANVSIIRAPGGLAILPPVSPVALLTNGPPISALGLTANSNRILADENILSTVRADTGDNLPALQQRNQKRQTNIGIFGVSDPTLASCNPPVTCAPFFSVVLNQGLGCSVTPDIEGVSCLPATQRAATIISNSRGSSFSPPNIDTFTAFTEAIPPEIASRAAFSNAIAEGVSELQLRDNLDNVLLSEGIVLRDPQRPEFGHLQFFKTTATALALGRLATIQLAAARALRVGNQPAAAGNTAVSVQRFNGINTAFSSMCPVVRRCNRFDLYFRSSDGSCNNLQNPEWGKTLTPLQRILAPKYQDGISSIRRSVNGGELPSARRISTEIALDRDKPSPEFTLAVMQWGQFIDHDLTHAPIFRFDNDTGIECCDVEGNYIPPDLQHPECLPIAIPKNDPFFSQFGRRCMNFVRSLPAPPTNCTFGFREQMNQITHYLDGSAVYGSSRKEERELRRQKGTLKTQRRGLLPPDRFAKAEDCFLAGTGLNCFRAGDSRVNEQPHLSVIHTIWVRQHNRVAKALRRLNRNWNGERIFQEARKIVTAQIQHIVYNEWLPNILGLDVVARSGLLPRESGYIYDYNNSLDPSIINEFASVAFRFGHTLVQGMLKLFGKRHEQVGSTDLFKNFNRPALVYQRKGFDQLLRGLFKQPMQSFDNCVVDDVTNRLFQTDSVNYGLDLVALNIQRGRDHGISPYNDLREACGLPRARNFNDLRQVLRPKTVQALRNVYSSVDDVDPFIAGISEIPIQGGILGPTFTCIIRNQFLRLKFGDRFYYENGGLPSSFTEAQLFEIRKTSWAGIICGNSFNIDRIQPLAFRLPGRFNRKTSCSSPVIPKLSILPWIEI